jgi:hypothetical protein
MVADRYSVDRLDGKFHDIVQDVAELLSSAVGFNTTRPDLDENIAHTISTDEDFRRRGKFYRKVSTRDHRGKNVLSDSKQKHSSQTMIRMYTEPLNDTADFVPVVSKAKSKAIRQGPPSFLAMGGSSDTTITTEIDMPESFLDLSQTWQQDYFNYRETLDKTRNDVDNRDIDQRREEALKQNMERPFRQTMSLVSSWSTDQGVSLSSRDAREPVQYVATTENEVKQEPSLFGAVFSWATGLDKIKSQPTQFPTQNEDPRESLMTELKSKLSSYIPERDVPIDEVLLSRKAQEEKVEERVISSGSRAPPNVYSLSHVRVATANPGNQDDFMREVKEWRKSHYLRKVPSNEKPLDDKQQNMLPTQLKEDIEITTLNFIPDEVSSKQKIDDIPEIAPASSNSTRTTDVPRKKTIRKLRKHAPPSKMKGKDGWKIGNLKSFFTKKSTTSVNNDYVGREETLNEAGSVSNEVVVREEPMLDEAGSVSLSQSVQAEKNVAMTSAPPSLVEQRKAQLEDFLAAYAQKIHKHTPKTVPTPHMDDQPRSEGAVDPSGRQSAKLEPECNLGSVSQCTPRTTNSRRSLTKQDVINSKVTSFDKDSTLNQSSGLVSDIISSIRAQASVSSKIEDKDRSILLMGIKDHVDKPPIRGDAPSMTSSFSLPTAISIVHADLDGESFHEMECRLEPHGQKKHMSCLIPTDFDVEVFNGTILKDEIASKQSASPTGSSNHDSTYYSESKKGMVLQMNKKESVASRTKSETTKFSNNKSSPIPTNLDVTEVFNGAISKGGISSKQSTSTTMSSNHDSTCYSDSKKGMVLQMNKKESVAFRTKSETTKISNNKSSPIPTILDVTEVCNGTISKGEISSKQSTSTTMSSNHDSTYYNESKKGMVVQMNKKESVASRTKSEKHNIFNKKQQQQQHLEQDTKSCSPKTESKLSKSSKQPTQRSMSFDVQDSNKDEKKSPKFALSSRRQLYGSISLFGSHQPAAAAAPSPQHSSYKHDLMENERRRKQRKACLSTTLF